MSTNQNRMISALKLLQQEKYPEAEVIYQSILDDSPKNIEALHYLGLINAELQQFDSALDYLEQALVLAPTDPAIYNNTANIYKRLKQWDRATTLYLQALDLNGKHVQAHHNLAGIYSRQNEFNLALHHYNQAIQVEPDFIVAHYDLGLLFLKKQELKAAFTQFTNVATLNPYYLETAFYLGIIHLHQDDLSAAKNAFLRMLDNNPEHLETLNNLGVIALKTNQAQSAIDYFTKVLALNNDFIEARNNLASTFMHHDRFENALMHYSVLLETEPNNIEYHYNSGVAQMSLGHLKEATTHFERVLSIDANHFASLNNLAAICLRLGDKIRAEQLLVRALKSNPTDESSQHMLNAIQQKSNSETSVEYSRNLFDNYALYYDNHLTQYLNYRLPILIGETLDTLSLPSDSSILDLGCGTGLVGEHIYKFCNELTGVDISSKMIAKAEFKQIYKHLITDDIIHFFDNEKRCFDAIIAADVLPYFGNLSLLFESCSTHLKKGGYFIFTVEINQQIDWSLQTTGRFAHQWEYLQCLIVANNLVDLSHNTVVARSQDGQQVLEYLVVLKKI